MSHLFDLTSTGLGLVMNGLGVIDNKCQIANYTLSSASTGLKNLSYNVIPTLIDSTLTGANDDFSNLQTFNTTVYGNETSGISSLNNILSASLTGLNAYFTKQFGVNARTYIYNNDTNDAFLVGGSGAILGTVTTSSGAITSIAITNGGLGYNASAVVSVTIGTGAIIVPVVNGSGTITSFTISGTMSGYTGSSVAVITPTPIIGANYRFLYGRVMNDEFVFNIASRTYNGSIFQITTGTTDLLNLYGPSTLNLVIGSQGIAAGTVYTLSINGLFNSSTGISAGTLVVFIGSLTAAIAGGTKISVGTSGVKYECAQTLTSTGPAITPLSLTFTIQAGGTANDNFYLTTV